jgi:hypothetical protein
MTLKLLYMQEQNFEKQVRQKMEALSMSPSAPVWMKVEEEIRQKKQRRRIIFFWLTPALILVALWMFYPVHHDKVRRVENHSLISEQSKNQNSPLHKVHETASTDDGIVDANKTGAASEKNKEKTGIVNKATADLNRQFNATQPGVHNNHKFFPRTKPESIHASIKNIKQENTGSDTKITTTHDESASVLTTESDSGSIIAATVSSQPSNDIAKAVDPVPDNANSIVISRIRNKLSWAVYFAAGTSTIQNNFFPGMNKSADMYAAPSSVGSSSFMPPSPATKGLSWQVGVLARMKISARIELSGGIGYHYFNTHNLVGDKVVADSPVVRTAGYNQVVTSYFRNGRNNNFTNAYHFMEIPVTINWRVHRHLPLNLRAGFSVAYMFSNEAIVYDGNYDVYYNADKFLNKTQLHFSSSLDYRILNGKSKALFAGPYFQYGISPLENNRTNLHLFSTGLGARISF